MLSSSTAGRADAASYYSALLRVDPQPTTWRSYLDGLVLFGMGQFEESIAALETIGADSIDQWARLGSLFFRTSALAHLGRTEEAEAMYGSLVAEIERRGDAAPSLLLAQTYFPFKQAVYRDRLLDGLRKAGMPEMPFGFSTRLEDRLTGEEIRSLVFGHEIGGRNENGTSYTRITAEDGATQVRFGSGPWESVTSMVEGDALCAWSNIFGGSCGAIFRNPEGTPENQDEYQFVRAFDYREFSVVR